MGIEKIKFHEKRDISNILRLRKKKPRFMRQELPKLKRLKDRWRRPRGIDSKKREGKRGKGKLPKIGYKKPTIVRGIHPSGFYPVLVHNVEELTLINPEEEAAIIASAIGRRKRNEIIRSANELNVTILNPRKGEL
ncbi:MAG: 50S ribosomal protein L32e [Candidatus Altiarchaeales archaeon]|nr:MAG: 50S ribosomal protein L32e [Candidatus Altiarchaeales archaeon]